MLYVYVLLVYVVCCMLYLSYFLQIIGGLNNYKNKILLEIYTFSVGTKYKMREEGWFMYSLSLDERQFFYWHGTKCR